MGLNDRTLGTLARQEVADGHGQNKWNISVRDANDVSVEHTSTPTLGSQGNAGLLIPAFTDDNDSGKQACMNLVFLRPRLPVLIFESDLA